MSTSRTDLYHLIDQLPEAVLPEAARFLEFMRFKLKTDPSPPTPYVPVALAGLWQGVTITDNDITTARREMWQGFGETIE